MTAKELLKVAKLISRSLKSENLSSNVLEIFRIFM